MRSIGSVMVALVAAFIVIAAPSISAAEGTDENTTLEGYVYGVVEDKDVLLSGANVVATSASGTVYKAITNNGYFILSCPDGTYTLEVRCGGFKDVTMENVVPEDRAIDIRMDLRDTSVIWGLDVPHVLELVGASMVLAILVIGAVLINVLRRSSKITVINDTDDPLRNIEDLEELEDEFEDEEYVYEEDVKES